MGHTPTPWEETPRFHGALNGPEGRPVANFGGYDSALDSERVQAENLANRAYAKACVNAFHGTDLEPEQIKVGLIKQLLEIARNNVRFCSECKGEGVIDYSEINEPDTDCDFCKEEREILAEIGK